MIGVENPYAKLEIEQLKVQIERLTAEVADLRAAQHMDREGMTDDICHIYQRLTQMNEYIWPVVHKVFPKYADDVKRIDALLQVRLSDASAKSPPKQK